MDDIPVIKELLSEARRTYGQGDDRVADRFVEIRPGLVSQLLSRAHHVIQGRRGTGKSTVLQVIGRRAKSDNVPVVIVDMERHKHRHYPDVLIEILLEVVDNFPLRRSEKTSFFAVARLRRRISRASRFLTFIQEDPDVIKRSIRRDTRLSRTAAAKLSGKSKGSSADGSASWEAKSAESVSGIGQASKIQRLRELSPLISTLLSDLVAATKAERSLIFIDDYYFISTEEQPLVLDYLHGVCKGTGVWLKIGGVGSRLKLYREGDPPIGVQVDQDVSRLKLDVTLEEFVSAKTFLEKVLGGILVESGYSITTLMNEGARNRIVLASGGAVPRDYINLILESLDIAIGRVSSDTAKNEKLIIQTEDINRAARRRIAQKEEEDLKQDAGADAPALRHRWQDIQAFANDRGQTNFVLFKQGDLTDEAWGKEIQQLENLRLLHRVGIAVPNTKTWRQTRVVIMMIDLAAIVNQRMGVKIVEFWKGQREFDTLRRAQWVYEPNWKQKGANSQGDVESLFTLDD